MRFRYGFLLEVIIFLLVIPAGIFINRSLGADSRGILAAMTLMPALVSTLISCQWERTLKSQLSGKSLPPEVVWAKTQKYFLLMWCLSIPLCGFLIATQGNLTVAERILAFIYGIFFVPLYLAGLFFISYFSALNRLWKAYAIKLIVPLLYLAIILIGTFSSLISVNYALLATIVPMVFAGMAGGFFLWSLHLPKASVKLFKDAFSDLGAAATPFVLEVVSLQADVWFLSTFVGNMETGAYVAFRIFCAPISIISAGLIGVGSGRIQWNNEEMARSFAWKGGGMLVLTGVAVMAGTWFLGGWAVNLVLGPSFSLMTWMLPYIVLGGFLYSLTFFLLQIIQMRGHQKSYLALQSADGIMRIALVCICGRFAGASGVLIGVCAAGTIKLVSCCLSLVWINHKSSLTITA